MDAGHETATTNETNHAASAAPRQTGGCHCGQVRFEADFDLKGTFSRCNCTLCTKRSGTTAIVAPGAFRLLAGATGIGDYAWGGRTGHFYFCLTCGIHVFGRGHLPQLGGDYVSVNVLCVDNVDPAHLEVIHFDGRHNNWQAGPRPTPWPVAT